MDSSKDWYLSKGIWGSLVTVVIGLLISLGAVNLEGEKETITDLLVGLATIITGAVALVGRARATKEIKPPGTGTGIFLVFIATAILILVISGCGAVQMAPDYRYQVENAAVVVAELDKRCQAGDDEACKEGLKRSSETLNLIVDGLYGRGGQE